MLTIGNLNRFSSRLLILSILLLAPFLRMLFQEGYGLFYPEVAVSIGLILGVAALLAAIARTPLAFHVIVLVAAVLLSVNAVRADFFPDARWRLPILLCITAIAGAMWLFRNNFYAILTVFIVGGLAIDAGKPLIERWRHPLTAQAQQAGKLNHVVHIILDEMIGLAAMPPECEECVRASNVFQDVLGRGNFQIYPNAFSNYRSTRDSIPSILNGRLLKRASEFFSSDPNRTLLHLGERGRGSAMPFLHENRYFDYYLSKGWAVRSYQSDYILYSAPEYPAVQHRTYRANSLEAIHLIPLPWTAKMRQLFIIYLRSDRFWSENWTRFMPATLKAEKLDIGPIAVQNIWPNRILEDFRRAKQNTVFFVHLLSPHYPYVFEPDGQLRDWHDWSAHSDLEFNEDEQAEYENRYRLYGRQAQYAGHNLDRFLKELKATGLYDLTTVIIHGDHGSRLRLFTEKHRQWRDALFRSEAGGRQSDRYDYPPGEPAPRDLLNQFATLLAIKLPGSNSPRIVDAPGSVLYYLQQVFDLYPADPMGTPEGLNAVYLFDKNGSPRQIKIRHAFKKAAGIIQLTSTEDTK
jgi:hypothetical protein